MCFKHSQKVILACKLTYFDLICPAPCCGRIIRGSAYTRVYTVCKLGILGSISPTYLRRAFTPVAPKSVRTQSSCQYLFTLLGSTSIKSVHRTLMKLTPGVKARERVKAYQVNKGLVIPNASSVF